MEYCRWGVKRRQFGLLAPRLLPLETKVLVIPAQITTEDALWDYVQKRKPYWLHESHRKRRTL